MFCAVWESNNGRSESKMTCAPYAKQVHQGWPYVQQSSPYIISNIWGLNKILDLLGLNRIHRP